MNNKAKGAIRNLVLSALFIATGIILPFFTGQIQQIGNMLLPMHIPVFLCGLICGWQYGAAVGLILPLLRSLIFIMPPMYPTAIGMAAELSVYGLVCGLVYMLLKRKNVISVYISLLSAMVCGRAIWGVSQIILLGFKGNTFTFSAFLAGAFFNAIPGIILQLTLIPGIMSALHITGVLRFGAVKEKTTSAV